MVIVMVVLVVLTVVIPLLCLTMAGFILQLDHIFMDGVIANRIKSRFSGNASNDRVYDYIQWFAAYEAKRMGNEQFNDVDAVNEHMDKIWGDLSNVIVGAGSVEKDTAEYDTLTTVFYNKFKESYIKSNA